MHQRVCLRLKHEVISKEKTKSLSPFREAGVAVVTAENGQRWLVAYTIVVRLQPTFLL